MFEDSTKRDPASQYSSSAPSANTYRRGPSSNARPVGDYHSSSATNANASSFPAYNPYNMGTVPMPQRQQQDLDWYSSSSAPIMHNAANDVKPVTAPSPYPYSATGHVYPSAQAESNSYNHQSVPGNAPASNGSLPYPSFTNLKKTESLEILNNNPIPVGNTFGSGDNLSGAMSSNPYQSGSYTNFFQKNMNSSSRSTNDSYYNYDDYSNEPPLLEELGINLSHITSKSLAVLLPMSRRYAKSSEVLNSHTIEESPDLAGPLAFAILLGSELLLAGKIQFAYIYSLSLFSCIAMTLLLNLLSPNQSISIWTVISVLGYCLLPVNLVAAMNIFIRIKSMKRLGLILAAMTILWCSISATRLFEKGCNLREQRWLVGYPCVLLYAAFLMITIF